MDKPSQLSICRMDTDPGDTFCIHPTYLEVPTNDKNTPTHPSFYLCCIFQGEVSALHLPAASLHFQPKYVKLHKGRLK